MNTISGDKKQTTSTYITHKCNNLRVSDTLTIFDSEPTGQLEIDYEIKSIVNSLHRYGFYNTTFFNNLQSGPLVGIPCTIPAEQGYSVSMSGDGNIAVSGGPSQNGYQGAIWIFERSNNIWTQSAGPLVGSGSIGSTLQGSSVGISKDGTTIAVGGPGHNSGSGAVWIFTKISDIWVQQAGPLIPIGQIGNPAFGSSLELSDNGNTLVVGGPSNNSSIGAAWIFNRTGTTWAQQAGPLVGSNYFGVPKQGVGVSISGDGNTIAVGGPDNGDVVNNLPTLAIGATWVYTRISNTWSEQSLIITNDYNSNPFASIPQPVKQGTSIDLSTDGNTIVIGGPLNRENNDILGISWVFIRNGSTWVQESGKLIGTNSVGTTLQGNSVGISGDGNTVVVGGYSDGSSIITSNPTGGVGAIWLFTRSNGVWIQNGEKIIGPNNSFLTNQHQGFSVSISDDSSSLCFGGKLYDNNSRVGAMWIFTREFISI